MARTFDWIGARRSANPEWPHHLAALYEACRTAYDLEALLSRVARLLPGATRQDSDALGRAQYDAMQAWMALEAVAAPAFRVWERQQELIDWHNLMAARALRRAPAPRIVPVVAAPAVFWGDALCMNDFWPVDDA